MAVRLWARRKLASRGGAAVFIMARAHRPNIALVRATMAPAVRTPLSMYVTRGRRSERAK